MAPLHPSLRTARPVSARQRGLTLIEFMVSIAIGMIVVAALATLIADQSSNRAEVDRAGRMIENGRYAVRSLAEEMQMAGYWGELSAAPAGPAAWADPCGAVPTAPTKDEIVAAMGLHISGFEVPGAAPLAGAGYNATEPPLPPMPVALDCLSNLKPGTDVIVLRHADPDSTPYETAGVPDAGKLGDASNGARVFIQTGLDAVTNLFTWKADTGANHAALTLVRKDKVTKATVRKMVVRIYYVTTCSVCSGTPDAIPSLKMKELIDGPAWSDAVTLAEGIENLQVEYGIDSAAAKDGAADGADVAGSGVAIGDWPAVVSAKLYVLARALEPTPGYTDDKTYPLGLAGTVAAANDSYKRHVFVQTVRLVNPSFRRSL